MDQWTDATWPDHARSPTLRAVSGHTVRLLPRPAEHQHVPFGEPLPAAVDDEPDCIRVIVVGDDVLARQGVLAALEGQPGLVVVGDHRSGPEVCTAISAQHPDVLLLHGLHGEEAAPTLDAARRASRTMRVLRIGVRGEQDPAALGDWVFGLLPASATPEEVVAAVRMAAAGFILRRPRSTTPALSEARRPDERIEELTGREREVLALVAKGMSNAEIAEELTLSEHTVKSHVQNLLSKLQLRNRVHAVIFAFETGVAHTAEPRPAGR